jgi:dipeptidyl aminopeptidase/acylaminoacyl peptidase
MRTGVALAVAVALVWPCATAARAACPDDVAQAATREQVSFESGPATVRGLIYRPAHPNGAGVLLLHGARGLSADAPVFDPHAVQLASRGYHVLVPNYYDAEPGRERRTARDLRIWRRAASDGAEFLAAQPGVEPGRVALWGYSLGGFLAGEAAMEAGGVAAAVSVAGGLDAGEAGRERRAVPLLLIHARRDPVISPNSTRRWGDGLQRRGATVEVQALDWAGHGLDGPTWCDVFGRTRAFLERSLIGEGG